MQHSKLWGATPEHLSGTIADPYECMGSVKLLDWKGKAEALCQGEVNTFGGTVVSIELSAYHGGGFPYYNYHRMAWKSGIYSDDLD